MEVGAPCFAHVRSYPWWPAKVVSKSDKKKEVYQVVFFGTGETANLPMKELTSITSSSIFKFCSLKSLKRKYFKEGMEQMKTEFPWIKSLVLPDQTSSENLVEKDPNEEEKSNPDRNISSKQLVSCMPLTEITNAGTIRVDKDGEDTIEGSVDNILNTKDDDSFDWGEYQPLLLSKTPRKKRDYFAGGSMKSSHVCQECGKSFPLAVNRDMHVAIAHADKRDAESSESDAGTNLIKASTERKKAVKFVKTDQKKRSKPALPKLVKSLREDEADGNKAFAEKIKIKDNFFYCQHCSKFSTASKLKARCHALSCGNKKPKTRKGKLSACLLCEEVFKSEKFLRIHNKTHHVSQSYTCSTCEKKFTLRQNYRRHLATHENTVRMACPVANCVKVFNKTFNLKRHIKLHKKHVGQEVPALYGVDLGAQSGYPVTAQLNCSQDQSRFQDCPSEESLSSYPGPVFALPSIDFQLSNVQEVHSGSDIIIDCNFVLEPSASISNTDGYYYEIVEEENDDIAFIENLVSEVVTRAIIRAISARYDTKAIDASCTDALAPENPGYLCNTHTLHTPAQDQDSYLQSQHQVLSLTGFANPMMIMTGPNDSGFSSSFPCSTNSVTSSNASVPGSVPGSSSSVSISNHSVPEEAAGQVQNNSSTADIKIRGQSQGMVVNKGYTCPYCGIAGIVGPSKLNIHIERMHSAPVVCKICSVQFVDKHCFVLHYPKCFYFCQQPNCNFFEKRKERFDGHMRTHKYD